MKERVIGAIALVAIAVLVVPVFLDGPSSDNEIVSESVTLPGQSEGGRKRQTIVLERDREQPVPAARNTAATTAAEKLAADEAARKAREAEAAAAEAAAEPPQPSAQAAAPRPQPETARDEQVAKAEPASNPDPAPGEPSSATGMWAVQLGSFSNQANAERLAADLRSNGYAAFLSQLKTSSGSLHRVRVGPQKDRDSAETVAGKLGADGHKGQVVPHP